MQNLKNIVIRQETQEDYKEVYELQKAAFMKEEHSDHDEQNLVERLRKSEAFVPELSLVAAIDNKIAGHILFTRLKAGNTVQVSLAPLAVLPQYQGKGIGRQLIMEGHRIAKELGYEYVILIGHKNYYPRFGYTPASGFGMKAPFEVEEDCFMAINLRGKHTMINAAIEYPKEFGL